MAAGEIEPGSRGVSRQTASKFGVPSGRLWIFSRPIFFCFLFRFFFRLPRIWVFEGFGSSGIRRFLVRLWVWILVVELYSLNCEKKTFWLVQDDFMILIWRGLNTIIIMRCIDKKMCQRSVLGHSSINNSLHFTEYGYSSTSYRHVFSAVQSTAVTYR